MNLFARIGSAWSTLVGKAAPPGSYGAGWGGGSWFSDAFRTRRAPTPHELVDAYKSLVYACVNLNANAVARLPLRLYATTGRGQERPRCEVKSVSRATRHRLADLGYAAKAMAHAERVEEVTEHPLLDALFRTNDDLDHVQLLTYTVMSLDIVGSAYWWPSLGRHRLPEEFWALPPHLVYPQFTSGSMVPDSYLFGGASYPKDSLIRFRRLSARNPYGQGYGPEQAAIEYARLEDTFVSIQDDMLSNGPRPSVIVSHKDPKGTFGTAERSRLEADMNRKGRGGRAGSAFVVDGSVAVTPISYSPTDLGTKDLSLYDLERIANCFDVPVSMLRTEDVNRANAEAGLEQHGRHAVEPRCKLIASALTRWTRSLDVSGARGWDRLVWAFDPAVNADRQAEAALHKTYVSLGLPLNVALTEAGYDAVAGGDVPLVPGGLKPLASIVGGKPASARPAPASEAGPGSLPIGPGQESEGGDSALRDVELKNCGTGAGGFQLGNTCACGRDGCASQSESQEGRTGSRRRPNEPARMSATPRASGSARDARSSGDNNRVRGRDTRGPGAPAMSATRPPGGARGSAPARAPEASASHAGSTSSIATQHPAAAVSSEDDRAALRETLLDLVGITLDIAGIFDPSPTSDGSSAVLSLYRGELRDGFLSLLGILPALGDLGKVGKIPSYVKKFRRAIRLARKNEKLAAEILPKLRELGKLLDGLEGPLRKLPESVSKPLLELRDEINHFTKNPPKVSVESVPKKPAKPLQASSGKKPPKTPQPSTSKKPAAKPDTVGVGKPAAKPEAAAGRKPKAKPQEPTAKPEASKPKRRGGKSDAGKPAGTRDAAGKPDVPDTTAPGPKKPDSPQGELTRPIRPRLPKYGTWEGVPGNSNFKPNNPAELGLKPGEVIPFRNGRPDFSKWSRENFKSKEPLTGLHRLDESKMIKTIAEEKGWTQQQVRKWLRSKKLSPHHSGGDDFQLIPWSLHGNPRAIPPIQGIRHTGGAYDLRNLE